MLYIFATKSAIKERHHSKYHHQMVFHIPVPSNILTYMTRMPLGTLGIKFRDSKMFIHRNRLNRLMSLSEIKRSVRHEKANNYSYSTHCIIVTHNKLLFYTAMYLLAFHALLRVGEFTYSKHKQGIIQVSNVKIHIQKCISASCI